MSNSDSDKPRPSRFPQSAKQQTGAKTLLEAALNQGTSHEPLRLEGDLIQQQRQLLRAYHQTATPWAKVEADAKAQLKREQEAAKAKLNQVQAQADEQLSKIQGMLT